MHLNNISEIDSDDLLNTSSSENTKDSVLISSDLDDLPSDISNQEKSDQESLDINDIDLLVQEQQDKKIYQEKNDEQHEMLYSDIEDIPEQSNDNDLLVSYDHLSNDSSLKQKQEQKANFFNSQIEDRNIRQYIDELSASKEYAHKDYSSTSSEINDFSSFLTIPEEEIIAHRNTSNTEKQMNDSPKQEEEFLPVEPAQIDDHKKNQSHSQEENNKMVETGFTTGNKNKRISIKKESIGKVSKITEDDYDVSESVQRQTTTVHDKAERERENDKKYTSHELNSTETHQDQRISDHQKNSKNSLHQKTNEAIKEDNYNRIKKMVSKSNTTQHFVHTYEVPKNRPSRVYNKPLIPSKTKHDDSLFILYQKVFLQFKDQMEKKEFDEAFKWAYLRHYKSMLNDIDIHDHIINHIKKRNKFIYSVLYRIVTKDDSPTRTMALLVLQINQKNILLFDGFYSIIGIMDNGIKRKVIEQKIKVCDILMIMNSKIVENVNEGFFKEGLYLNNNSIKVINNDNKLGYSKYKTFLFNLNDVLLNCGSIPFIECIVSKIIESRAIIKIGSFKRVVDFHELENVLEEINENYRKLNKADNVEINFNIITYQKILFNDLHSDVQGILFIYNSRENIIVHKKYRIHNVIMKEFRIFMGKMEYVEEI